MAYAAGAIDDEGSSEAIGSEADDEEGGRALGRSLDALAAEASRPGWESVDEEVMDN